MRSLFVQLWLAFLVVTAATFAASVAFGYGAAIKRSGEADLVSPAILAKSAQQALSRGGTDALDGWVVSVAHRQPEIAVYFVDGSGRELFGRNLRGQAVAASLGRPAPSVTAPDGTNYTVVVRRVRRLVFDFWRLLLSPWPVGALILTISALGCATLAWLMSRPVRQLRSAVREVAAGRLDVEIAKNLARRGDELGWLARDFRQMTLDLRKLISSKEKLLRDVSHELRSPLTRLRLAADLGRTGVVEHGKAFQRIDREVERLDSMIGQILQFSRNEAAQPILYQRVDVAALLQQAVDDVGIEAAAREVKVAFAGSHTVMVQAEPSKLSSAIDNVIRNAIHHAPAGSSVEVRLLTDDESIRILVTDRGPGIAVNDEVRIFEPFYRGASSSGAGLGLAIAKSVMEQHGGSAVARNRTDGGLAIELALPAARLVEPELSTDTDLIGAPA
jgi:two-component system sensor histidine kinase CpxA